MEKSASSLRIPFHRPFDLGITFMRSIGTLVRLWSCCLRPDGPAAGSRVMERVSLPHLTVVAYVVMVLML